MSTSSKLMNSSSNSLTNFANLSLQLQSLKKEAKQKDSKASTPSTESSASRKQSNTQQLAKKSTQRKDQKSIFQNACKNILNSNVERQLRTNSATSQIQSKIQDKQQKQIFNYSKPIIYEDFSQHPFKHLIRGKNVTRLKFIQFLEEIQSQLKFSKFLKIPGLPALKNKRVQLDEQKMKPTLVLDMDETLIHSVINPRFGKHSVQIHSQFQKYQVSTYFLAFINVQQQFFNIRPYAQELLKELSEIYEIIVFSASIKEYITAICNYLDPQKQYISKILSRDNCYITPNGYLIKDLRVLQNRNLDRVIIVDNLALCFAFQIQNGIPILPWLGDQKDEELKYMIDYLKELSQEQNIAQKNFQNLKLNILANLNKTQIYHPK